MVAGMPVRPDEVGSPHAPGAILMKGVLTESLVSPANPIPDYFVFEAWRRNSGQLVYLVDRRERVSSSVQKG